MEFVEGEMRKREREQESKRKRKRNEKEKVLKNLGSDKKKKKNVLPLEG